MGESFERVIGKPEFKIRDAANQLAAFALFKNIDEARARIAQTEFKTLEAYSGLSTGEIEEVRPGVCEKYNALVQKIQDPHLTRDALEGITRDVLDATRQ